MRWILVAVLVLAACDSPGPRYAKGGATKVSAGGHTFSVYRSGDTARAVRTNRTLLPDAAEVMASARAAAMQATGCDVPIGGVTGDAAIVTMRLDCG